LTEIDRLSRRSTPRAFSKMCTVLQLYENRRLRNWKGEFQRRGGSSKIFSSVAYYGTTDWAPRQWASYIKYREFVKPSAYGEQYALRLTMGVGLYPCVPQTASSVRWCWLPPLRRQPPQRPVQHLRQTGAPRFESTIRAAGSITTGTAMKTEPGEGTSQSITRKHTVTASPARKNKQSTGIGAGRTLTANANWPWQDKS
jgi:hypothetical protein